MTIKPSGPLVGHRAPMVALQLQLELLAHHASEETVHRMLLPAGLLHHCGDRRTRRDRSIAITRACLGRAASLSAGDFATAASGALGAVARSSLDFGRHFLPDVLKGFGIGISIGSRGRRRTTEAPPRPLCRRGRIPTRNWTDCPPNGRRMPVLSG
jgi:hypothetical protein